MRTVIKWPQSNWVRIWKNLKDTPVSEENKVMWYKAINDNIPTRSRLHNIHLAETGKGTQCQENDNLQHRLSGCNEGTKLWKWTQTRIAIILRTAWKNILPEWLERPDFHQWPPKRNRAVLWFLTCYVSYRLNKGHAQTLEEYHDYLRRTRWKMEQTGTLNKYVGNYLSVVD
jgi:hypothetical protein